MAENKNVWERVPLVEMKMPDKEAYIDQIERMESPRLFKSHLPVWFFENEIAKHNSKCIVIMRNPKDMLVSYYHFLQLRHPKIILSWDQWFDMFRSGDIQYGDWFDHVLAWWKHLPDQNFLFLTYEGMKADTLGSIQRIATHINVTCSKDYAEELMEKTSFEQMKKDPSSNLSSCSLLTQAKGASFIRRGTIGDWKNYFTVQQDEYMDKLIDQRLTCCGLGFVYNE